MQFGTMAVVLVFLSQHFIALLSKATKGYKSWYY